jgi:hypothetical protein
VAMVEYLYVETDDSVLMHATVFTMFLEILGAIRHSLRETLLYGALQDELTFEQVKQSVIQDPVSQLQMLGCELGPERKITTLYKVRDHDECNVIGYPIFISEA